MSERPCYGWGWVVKSESTMWQINEERKLKWFLIICGLAVLSLYYYPKKLETIPTVAEPPAVSTDSVVSAPVIPSPHSDSISAATDEVSRAGWHSGCELIDDILPELVELAPTDFQSAYMIAGCLQEIYQEEHTAIRILENALEQSPGNSHIAHMLGNGYLRVGDDLKVEETLEKLLANEDAIDELWYKGHGGAVRSHLAAAKLRLAAPSQDIDRLYEAKTLLQEANQIEGLQNISPVRHGQLAHVEMALGDFDEAIRQFETAIDLTEQNEVWGETLTNVMLAENLMGLGQALFLQGSIKLGYEKMDQAVELVADTPLEQTLKLIRKSMDEPVILEQDPTSNIKNAVPLEEHVYKEWKQ